jgi:hypothetical protein
MTVVSSKYSLVPNYLVDVIMTLGASASVNQRLLPRCDEPEGLRHTGGCQYTTVQQREHR